MFANILPAGAPSPASPSGFGGFVVNLNVCTRIHRDPEDLRFCVVLVLSESCRGGDLCFQELGLRLSLRNGDMVVFQSHALSHFNLHFQGKRASVVLHTDRAGLQWIDTRNGWIQSAFMNSSQRSI